jgi:hypothetical protein
MYVQRLNGQVNFLADDDMRDLRTAYGIAWIGASNPRPVKTVLAQFTQKHGADHYLTRCIAGHLAFLNGTSLGPDDDDLRRMRDEYQATDEYKTLYKR